MNDKRCVQPLWAVALSVMLLAQPATAQADGHDEGPMGDLCLTCWGQPESGQVVTPEGTWQTWKDPTPPVWNYDFGGVRQRERQKERERREEE